MKKKLIIATALILLLAVSMTMFVGCDEIFKNNEKRDATQVVASVTYNGQTANVYKYELAASFDSYAYMYVSYYGMTYEGAANYLAQSLAQQELLVLFAKNKVAELLNVDVPEDIADLLSQSEINKAYENANDSFISSLKTIVENTITDDNYNNGSAVAPEVDKDDDKEIENPVYVRFNSNGGSAVTKVKVEQGDYADAPTDPTKSGYTFYGWFANSDLSGDEFDFDTTVIDDDVTLYAKWVKYTAPRTELPEKEEEEDDDYDADDDTVEPNVKTFFEFTNDDLYEELKDEDFVDKMTVAKNSTVEATLKDYIKKGLDTLKSNMKKAIFNDTDEEGYDYYLLNQMETLLIERLERMLGANVAVSPEEIEAEFQAAVDRNKETFAGSDAGYSSALTSALNKTYYHPVAEQGYGFVSNILLKLDDTKLEELTTLVKNNPSNSPAILIRRNQLISTLTVKVSNPDYNANTIVKDADGNEIELRDPMTDPANPYNKDDAGNNYDQIVSFEQVDGEWTIKFNAKQHESMAYLLQEVPAFDVDGKVGIIHQIQNTFDQVRNAGLSKSQEIYWLREVAMTWCYLVGDDTGATNSQSNNGGLGYLITPEGKSSSYLADFTDFARDLIKAGTGSSSVGTLTDDMFKGDVDGGVLAGNNKAFVVADSFIESGNTSNAYAGVFVLLSTLTAYDGTLATLPSQDAENAGVLPMTYPMIFAKDADDCKTIEDVIKDDLLEAKKLSAYNLIVNTMADENKDNYTYYYDVIKTLWKDLQD